MQIEKILQKEFKITDDQLKNTIQLIDEGNTIPFIARYRKEMTGNLSDIILRDLNERLIYLRNLIQRKEDITRIIQEQEKLTPEILENIEKAKTLQEVEDIYSPFKQKKRTRATKAKEKGLEELANIILNQEIKDLEIQAQKFVNEEKEVNSTKDALSGAMDIIAEKISEDSSLRKELRKFIWDFGFLESSASKEEESVYQDYYEYKESIKNIPAHRILAVNRGEKEDFLKVKIALDEEKALKIITKIWNKKEEVNTKEFLQEAIKDSYKRLLFPSLEREIRTTLKEKAEEQAIKVFGKNLKPLLLIPPVKGKVVMGFDPAYRTGCKLAIVDETGKFLSNKTIFPTKPQEDIVKAKKEIIELINKYNVELIAIGNGTASRESEIFVSDVLKELNKNVCYTIVNEAGASIYSASELGTKEYPNLDVSVRGAISIARRLQDPLSELVKIEPKHIGVGQYQHDVNQKRLDEILKGVVEDVVNHVGVDLNTASASLLEYISGINKTIAQNIITYREEIGKFTDRKQIKKVKRLGDMAFKQCAGFLRIKESKNPLDNTSVHPESYKACELLIKKLGYNFESIKNEELKNIDIEKLDLKSLSQEIEIGELTLIDILQELKKPGRDPREESQKPVFRNDVLKIEDLKEEMIVKGTVRNIVDFGAFVDIGIKNDALLHKSEMAEKFVKDPFEILQLGDIIEARVIKIDLSKQRVSLSLKGIK